MPKITARFVETLAVDGADRIVWDTEQKGFGVRLRGNSRTFVVQYKLGGRGGQNRRILLGKVGTVHVEEARRRAKRILADVAEGKDPGAERRALAGDRLTISDLIDIYLAQGPALKPNKKASSWRTDASNLNRHVRPLLGRKRVAALAAADCARFQAAVATGENKADIKTRSRGRAIVRGGNGTAARALAVLGAMLAFGVQQRLIPSNPAKGVPLLKSKPRERFLTEAEVAALADAINGLELDGSLSHVAATAIRLLMLTGCRKGEILSLRWPYVDFERGCLRLPDSKTGAKVVALATAALEILTGMPRASEFVLPAGRGSAHYTGLHKDWCRVRTAAGLHGLRVHDLRHSFASFGIAGGQSLYVIGKLLGHSQIRVTEGYAHLQHDPLRAAADQIADRISRAMNTRTQN